MLVAVGLGVILAGAALLRFADLASNPGGLYMDEAVEALSAQRILHDADFRPIFLPEGGGREALFAYLVAGVFHFVGETPLALRATAAGIGVAGVLGVWLLGRRCGALAGLSAAAWAAGSLWLICISRNGMRNTLVPLFAAIALAALVAWHDRPGRMTAILAGATASLATLYTYQPLKLIPLLLLVWLVWLHRVKSKPACWPSPATTSPPPWAPRRRKKPRRWWRIRRATPWSGLCSHENEPHVTRRGWKKGRGKLGPLAPLICTWHFPAGHLPGAGHHRRR